VYDVYGFRSEGMGMVIVSCAIRAFNFGASAFSRAARRPPAETGLAVPFLFLYLSQDVSWIEQYEVACDRDPVILSRFSLDAWPAALPASFGFRRFFSLLVLERSLRLGGSTPAREIPARAASRATSVG